MEMGRNEEKDYKKGKESKREVGGKEKHNGNYRGERKQSHG